MSKARVVLEPSLEIQVVTFDAKQRRALADVYRRWIHQLELSAKILEDDAALRPSPKPPPILPLRLLCQN